MSILEQITLSDFPTDQYVREETKKTMIHLHHTAGNANPFSVLEYWATNKERVATHFVIGGPPPKGVKGWADGQIIQTYSTKYWAYHLGLKSNTMLKDSMTSTYLNSRAIGIEICNWGQLTKGADGNFRNWNGGIIPKEQVVELQYRGYKYWHKYSDAQLESTRQLLLFLGEKWGIPLKYKGVEMFVISARAFTGEPGIWTHTSYRPDKVDCSPQPNLIKMLESL